jgi:hypothetical protein
MSINWYKASQVNVQPRMTLDSSGNLGIGTLAPSVNTSLTLGEESMTLEDLKSFKKMAAFAEFAAKADPKFAELWTAFNVANKLEK